MINPPIHPNLSAPAHETWRLRKPKPHPSLQFDQLPTLQRHAEVSKHAWLVPVGLEWMVYAKRHKLMLGTVCEVMHIYNIYIYMQELRLERYIRKNKEVDNYNLYFHKFKGYALHIRYYNGTFSPSHANIFAWQ